MCVYGSEILAHACKMLSVRAQLRVRMALTRISRHSSVVTSRQCRFLESIFQYCTSSDEVSNHSLKKEILQLLSLMPLPIPPSSMYKLSHLAATEAMGHGSRERCLWHNLHSSHSKVSLPPLTLQMAHALFLTVQFRVTMCTLSLGPH